MTTTPNRLNASSSRLLSPRNPASPAVRSQTVGASRVADSMTKFVDLYRKWKLTVQKGNQYCSAIENIKKGVLESKEQDCNPYPANLELYCRNLAVLISILEDVAADLDKMIEQLKVLHVEIKDEVVGISWTLGKVLNALLSVSENWKSELGVRNSVSENIGHSVGTAELALHVATWEQLSSQNENVELLVRMLSMEFNAPLD